MSSNTTRRTLLAGIGALVGSSSGCLGRAFSSEPVPADEYERTVSLKEVGSVPDSYGAEFEIEVAHAEITAERSAVLRTRVTSTSGEKRQFSAPYYKGSSSQAGKSGLLLYSKDAPDNPANPIGRPTEELRAALRRDGREIAG